MIEVSAAILAVVIGFIFGRVQGEHAGIATVVNSIRGSAHYFTTTEVVVGNVISWSDYEKNQFDHEGTVDGVASASRSANSKHEASVIVKGTEGYRHPFLCQDNDA